MKIIHDVGIVLKSLLPTKSKISLLSRAHGKLHFSVRGVKNPHRFSPGMALRFGYKSQQKRFLNDVEVLYIPFVRDNEHDKKISNLYWLHHLLEICYYFVPLGEPCREVFGLIQYAFDIKRCSDLFEPYFCLVQKIFLVRLFVYLGFFPPRRLVYLISLFDDVVLIFLDSSNEQKVSSLKQSLGNIDKKTSLEIDDWIGSCLRDHPLVMRFKTLSFFVD